MLKHPGRRPTKARKAEGAGHATDVGEISGVSPKCKNKTEYSRGSCADGWALYIFWPRCKLAAAELAHHPRKSRSLLVGATRRQSGKGRASPLRRPLPMIHRAGASPGHWPDRARSANRRAPQLNTMRRPAWRPMGTQPSQPQRSQARPYRLFIR